MKSQRRTVVWTDYMRYRARLRGFDLDDVSKALRSTDELYFDTETRRTVAVARIGEDTVMVPLDTAGDTITPVTIHVTTRQQIRFRITSGRFTNA